MTTNTDAAPEIPRKVLIRKTGQVWGWSCPCCLNFPGWSGHMFMETALDAGLAHAALVHPRIDWDRAMEDLNA